MEYLINEGFLNISLKNFSVWTYGLPLFIALFLPVARTKTFRTALIGYLVTVLATEYFGGNYALITDLFSGTNAPVYYLVTPLYLFWQFRIYRLYLSKVAGLWLPVVGIATLVIIGGIDIAFGVGFYKFPTVEIAVYSFIGILLPLGYLFYLLRSLEVSRLEKDPMFVLATGFLLYFSGNFLLWIFLNYITGSHEIHGSVYYINFVLTILLNVFLSASLLMQTDEQKKITLPEPS